MEGLQHQVEAPQSQIYEKKLDQDLQISIEQVHTILFTFLFLKVLGIKMMFCICYFGAIRYENNHTLADFE